MKLLSLGHSSYVLEMMPRSGDQPVRILADPWLSDAVVGDLLGRFPRIRLEPGDLLPLHGIYLSHAHTDHLDPYSLVRLWQGLDPHPTLLLPESLRYLEGLLEEYLEGAEIHFLRDQEPFPFHGISLMGFFNPETTATNEDEVMVLLARNGKEVFLGESDALLPFYREDTRELLSSLVEGQEAETICFLTIKNEGGATMSMLGARDRKDRKERLGRCLEQTYEEIHEIYTPLEDLEDDLWRNAQLVRLIGGQGICFPQKLNTGWNRVLFPIRISDRVLMEREVALQEECQHSTEEFKPGQVHHIENGRLLERQPAPIMELLDREEDRQFDVDLELFEEFPSAPLLDRQRNTDIQSRLILNCLNQRFLPHLIGARVPPLEHLLGKNGGQYRIRVRYGSTREHRDVDYQTTFEQIRFHPVEGSRQPDEFYWANDLEDFLEGRCDEFSTFCRHPLGGSSQRLWQCLGLPYLNNDLVEKKLRLHFERAARGESPEEWVLSFFRHEG